MKKIKSHKKIIKRDIIKITIYCKKNKNFIGKNIKCVNKNNIDSSQIIIL